MDATVIGPRPWTCCIWEGTAETSGSGAILVTSGDVGCDFMVKDRRIPLYRMPRMAMVAISCVLGAIRAADQ